MPLPPPIGRKIARAAARWDGTAPNLRGTLLLALAFLFFTVEVIAARMLTPAVPVAQLVLVRSVGQLVVLIPFILATGLGLAILRTRRLPLHLLRGTLSVVGLYLYFFSFAYLPLADATAISFTKALFLVMLAGLVLGETVGTARWGATIAGLVGVAIVMRPGVEGVSPAALAGLLGALSGAGLLLCTKVLASQESPLVIMIYVALVTSAASLGPGIAAWQVPDAAGLVWLALLGSVGPVGQYINIVAFRVAEASALAPVDYLRLIYSGAAGFLIFAEIPDAWTIAGAAVIVFATIALSRHEIRRARLERAMSPSLVPVSVAKDRSR